MTKDWNLLNQLEEVWFARIGKFRFDIYRTKYRGKDWKDKDGFIAKMRAGSGGILMANATGKTPNEAISNLLKCTVCNGGATIADIIGIKPTV